MWDYIIQTNILMY